MLTVIKEKHLRLCPVSSGGLSLDQAAILHISGYSSHALDMPRCAAPVVSIAAQGESLGRRDI